MAQEIDDLLSKVDDTSFVEKDWNVVFDECSPLASKWHQLSVYLGLNMAIIDRIKSDCPNDSLGCWSEALKEWIKMNYDTETFGKPSWKTLLKAIAKIDKLQFNRLATKHQASTEVHQTTEGTMPIPGGASATAMGDLKKVKELIEEKHPLEDIVASIGIDGGAPILRFAAACGNVEIVTFVITQLNCDPNIALPVEYQGRTTGLGGRIALHIAAEGGHLHVIKYLVEQCNCNPSHLDSEGVTPLHLAAQCGHLEVVQYLTQEQHCDPLCTNKKNDTPLHNAAAYGHLQVVRFFIEVLHCPSDVRGSCNMTPLDEARSQGHRHVVQYLESICPNLQ